MSAAGVPGDEGGRGEHTYAGRGGVKLRHALDAFGVDARGMRCADFGCNVGGFTDCLLAAGAAQVIALDTGYGTLAWKLRKHPRVTVMERTNALHAPAPSNGVDLVVIDMGWTPQRLCIPAAIRWLAPAGRIISLVKPHYEASDTAGRRGAPPVLEAAAAAAVVDRVLGEMPALGARVVASTASPIAGGKGGNLEWLALLEPVVAGGKPPEMA